MNEMTVSTTARLTLESGTRPRRTRELWYTWKQTTITIEDGYRFFVEFGRSTNSKGNGADNKAPIKKRLKLASAFEEGSAGAMTPRMAPRGAPPRAWP